MNEEPDVLSIPCCSWSSNCLRVLTQVAKQSPSHAELRDQLEMHRTTLRRKLNRLEDRQWIEAVPANNSYQITTTGHIVVTGIAELLANLQAATRLEAMQSSIPVELPFKPYVLDNCEIIQRHQHDPYAPISAFLDLVREAERFCGSLPTINPRHLDVFTANVTTGDRMECVSVLPAFELLQTKCPAAFETVREASTSRLFVCEELQSFGTCWCDDTVAILGYDDTMAIHTIVTAPSTCESVAEWVTNQYAAHKQAAVPYEQI